MDRRSLLKRLLISPLVIAGMASGNATALRRGDKFVLVFDPSKLTVNQAMQVGVSLGLPEGTRVVAVHCREGEHPEDAFALLETEK